MKRIFLFLATNMAIVLVLSVTMRLLGVEPYLNANGLNLTSVSYTHLVLMVLGVSALIPPLVVSQQLIRVAVPLVNGA